MQIELPDDDPDNTPEPATDGGSSTLGFANVDAASTESDASLIQRLPGRQAFLLGFVSCFVLMLAAITTTTLLF